MILEKTLHNLRKAKANYFNIMDDNINRGVFVKDIHFSGYGKIVGTANSLRKYNIDLDKLYNNLFYLVKVNEPNFYCYYDEYGIDKIVKNSRFFQLKEIQFNKN